MVEVTPKAVEKIRTAFEKEGVAGTGGLRLGVLGGGCSGLSYQFKFDQKPRTTDQILNFEGVQIFIDPKSLVYLDGMTLDWKDSLIHSGFVFDNPHAKEKLRLRNFVLGVMNYFDAFGLAPALTVDLHDLQRRFYALSRQWHPDKFTLASVAEQQKSLDMTSLLNDAFRVLRDPIARVEYFLEEQQIHPSKSPPPELLEEVFELNMALEELRDGDESARSQLLEAKARFGKMLTGVDEEIGGLSAEYDTKAKQDASLLTQIRGVLDRRQYVSNLLRDVNKAL